MSPLARPTAAIEAIPETTPFVGPEQLMRETGRSQLVRLGANESAFGPSPKAVAAMRKELERLSWYGDPESLDLRDALAEKHRCSPEQIVVGSGIDDLMGLAVRAFVGPGSIALTTRGTYPTLNYHVVGYGGELLFGRYRDDGTIDADELVALARERKPALIYLANPDNPSGRFMPKDELARFADALPGEALFLLDEAYADYLPADALLPMHFDDRLVRLRTFSKAYGMAGARIGYALTTQRNVRTFQKIRLHYGVNRNAQIGALASLQDEQFVEHVVAKTAKARMEYYALAKSLGRSYIVSSTNFVCIDMGGAQRATEVMDELLRRGVWVRKPGAPPLDRYVRVTAGTQAMRAAFADALRDALAELSVA